MDQKNPKIALSPIPTISIIQPPVIQPPVILQIENIEDNIYNSLNKNNKMDDNIWNLYDDFEELEAEAEACAEAELEDTKIMQNKCVNCNSTNFIQDSKTNNVVCNACGLVNTDNLDRTFSTNNSNSLALTPCLDT